MEQDNTIILTSTLMPSAIILAFAIVLTIWFHRTIDELPAPSALTIIINQNINPNGILLQQQPPIVAPIPRQPISIHNFSGEQEEEVITQSTSPIIQERRPPTPSRRHTPIIIISPTGSADSVAYVP